jgi:hypothetical protein
MKQEDAEKVRSKTFAGALLIPLQLATSIAPVLNTLLPIKDVKATLVKLVDVSKQQSNSLGLWEVVGSIVRHIADKSFSLPLQCFSILTPISLQSKTLALSFAEYLDGNVSQCGALNLCSKSMLFILEQGINLSGHKQLAEVLMKNREDMRLACEGFLIQNQSAIATYISPLLESVSEPVEPTSQFRWKSTIPDNSKNKIAKLISIIGNQLIADLPNPRSAETLRRAVSLCETDRSAILLHIANDRRRSTLTGSMTRLVEVLMSNRNLRDDEPKAWLYIASDHLTRRCAEDKKLDEMTLEFCEQMGKDGPPV